MKDISSVLEQRLNSSSIKKRRKFRAFKDIFARYGIAVGGMGVIVAITLIFFYLLYEVVPLFKSASLETTSSFSLPNELTASQNLALITEEQNEQAGVLTRQGQLIFFSTQDGTEKARHQLPLGQASITSLKEKTPSDSNLMLGLSNGQVIAATTRFQVEYNSQGERGGIQPTVTPLFKANPLQLDPLKRAIQQVTYQKLHDGFLVAGLVKQGEVLLSKVEQRTNFISGATQETIKPLVFPSQTNYQRLLIAPDAHYIFALTASGQLDVYNAQNLNSIVLDHSVQLVTADQQVTQLIFQLGQQSLLVGDSQGNISQWFMVRNAASQHRLTQIRTLKLADAPIKFLEAEQRRKGFIAIDDNGRAGIFNTTAEKKAIDLQLLSTSQPQLISLAPRASMLLALDKQGVVHNFAIDNKHPETSLKSLWGKVWYEGYEEPEYTWQSSSASTEFEPKFSLTPLAFGTLKAAFYAMLLSVPLAICGAMYTAYFMAPEVRNKVKPVIELMEALPTVILGFFAGLFLAPFMESHLTGVFALLIIMPLGIVTFAFAWAQLPGSLRHRVPETWHLVLVIPLVVLLGWLSIALSQPLEILFFAGDLRNWLTNDLGIPFDQRNAMVVGFAMGFAVIPTIYSIAEDALYGVPKSLSHGSLALGATTWQTLVRVVLPTASPGIFSAVMIGMGRAVGETMIVLMATGNTAVMNANIFEGMRTLAANIAVEMGESAISSSHYRVLFLAALVLFLFTFVVNTLAELVRQRLRKKYSSL
ncbi:ABC transporter permease subunit [Marinospirillum insulare]|uniref:Phosphate ABC transporter permease n=1 Tax=Marinospirillum insulare TaxID=217169 RepID=A0ABQ5ZYF1_9GAMM|nr:ABC transporter permease subunit [Marinospirillum insulare]GLR64047.1 phosphate ABC transporter permease [Marinospirillum insulare]